MKLLIAVLALVALAGCQRTDAVAYRDGRCDGYAAAVDSVRRISAGYDICRIYEATGVKYVIATYTPIVVCDGDTAMFRTSTLYPGRIESQKEARP